MVRLEFSEIVNSDINSDVQAKIPKTNNPAVSNTKSANNPFTQRILSNQFVFAVRTCFFGIGYRNSQNGWYQNNKNCDDPGNNELKAVLFI